MSQLRRLIYITLADFIVRAAYQIGKTPLLPILALSLGANDAFLGFIISVSTLTGMVLKPFIGLFSDRWGRRRWLIIGTILFTGVPFIYRFIDTPKQLFAIRIIHGLSTAIYGPVTVAYVAEQSQKHIAERLGWFGIARGAGYVVGPAVAGWLLLTLSPVSVFTAIGVLSGFAFLPIFLLPETTRPKTKDDAPLKHQLRNAFSSCCRMPSIWLAGSLEAVNYIGIYALKAFLPIYALSLNVSIALVGAFFALQEATHLLLKPLFGRLGDRIGYLLTICLGMIILGVTLPLFTYTRNSYIWFIPPILIGVAQALVFPSTVALVSTKIEATNIGTGMGLLGTLRNGGKVAGPVLAGVMIQQLDFSTTFHIIGGVVALGAGVVWFCGYVFLRKPMRRTAEGGEK